MKTLRILIVEDDPLVSMGLEMMVTKGCHGCRRG